MKDFNIKNLWVRFLEFRAKVRDGSQKAGLYIGLVAVVFFVILWIYEGRFPLFDFLPRR